MSRRVSTRLALALGFFLAGCTVEPYCLVCPDDGGEDVDAGPDRLDGGQRDAQYPDAPFDASDFDATCGTPEVCNGSDDDCDGHADEGIDLQTNLEHCGACDALCAPLHAFGQCQDGVCSIASCDVGWLDLNGDVEDGCEYRCVPTSTDGTDALCDFRDDDCDGSIDEDVDLQNDPENCGRCGRFCSSPRAVASCTAGECRLGACEPGHYDLDGSEVNGCEYACIPSDPRVESCNLRDDDCDGRVDEGDPGGGVACGRDEGACSMGLTACRAGEIVCEGAVVPTNELCNGVDDDCDGAIDENNPEGGRICGISTGACAVGTQQCVDGALVCVGQIEPVPETCNNLDDDCDGSVDEENPEGGATCGETEGACEAGMVTCVRGALVCAGGVGPAPELCNGVDDDCDGSVDEGDPEGGALCGSDVGRCAPGVQECREGSLVCVGAITPIDETCDGVDEDCDGSVDEGNPGGGAACGDDTGQCEPGTITCRTGALVCEGQTTPRPELCNGLDDDCDGVIDNGFSLMTDIRNCGACNRVCALANTTQRCVAGECAIGGCRSGYVDLDGVVENGCEYECSYAGAEACNGRDDDCDGTIDEGLVAPSSFCNPNGVCHGTVATCGGAAGWQCLYPSSFEETEQTCDGLDNDCDGRVDETFALVGQSCSHGIGTCRRTGVYECNGTGDGVECSAPPAGTPGSEECNGRDDDCDGAIDETGPDDPGTPWRDAIDASAIPHVTISSGGRTVRVMRYEASRPDATATSAGSLATLACSSPNVRPWTSVTREEAEAACCALNPGGTCTSPTSGWHLCDAADWEAACEGPAGSCDWSYRTSCSASQPLVCNGMEYDSDPALPGDQDAISVTGSTTTFAACYTDWGAAGRVYDLSGNVREWTGTRTGTQGGVDVYQVRGGSYQSVESGRTCGFDFTVAPETFRAPNTGFRCCMY